MIRAMTEADAPAVARILAASPGASQWSERDLLELLRSNAGIWVAQEDGIVTGLCATRAVAEEMEVLNLAVAPASRRRGVGRKLLVKALAPAFHEGVKQVFLEVRESNAAGRAFYQRMGFSESGRRRGYYRNPSEDALVLWRQASLESV